MNIGGRIQRWVIEALLENLPLKLLSLLVSLLIYAHLHGAEQNAQRALSVGVVTLLPSEDEGRVLLVDPPPSARVTLTGSRPILDDLRADDLGSLQLDLRQASGTYSPFDISTLKIPAGLQVEVDPPGILLTWDAVVVRPVQVQVPVTGQPARGFAVQGVPSPEPAMISARGPQSLIETLQSARSEPFDVGGLALEGATTRKLLLEPPPPRVQFVERSVLATVTLGRARAERVFTRLLVNVTGVTRPTVKPAEVDVRVAGPPELVEGLRPEQIVPIADAHAAAGDARSGSVPVPVTAQVDGCTVQIVPPTVVVKW